MSGSTQQRVRIEPLVVVETADLPRDDWLNYRRLGIGGSDVAAIMGVSPFRTARDIYYDKLGIVAVDPDESNWVCTMSDARVWIFTGRCDYAEKQLRSP